MLEKVIMQDCQSLKNVSYDFTGKGVNVIRAANGTGKSVFFKMLKATASSTYYTRKKREKLIRYGCSCAQVGYAFQSGAMGIVRVFPDKIIYAFQKEGEKDFTLSTEPPQELLSELGLVLGQDDFVANILDTEQGQLLVNPKLKSNVSLMKLLVTCPELDNLKLGIEHELELTKDLVSDLGTELNHVNRKLEASKFIDVNELEQEITCLQGIRNTLFSSIELTHCIQSIKRIICKPLDYGTLLDLSRFLIALVSLTNLLSAIESLKEPKCEELVMFLLKIQALESSFSSIKISAECVNPDCAVFLEQVSKIHQLFQDCVLKDINFNEMEEKIDLTLKISDLANLTIKILELQKAQKECSISIEELKDSLLKSGDRVACPIHKEVIYNGEECIPIGF